MSATVEKESDDGHELTQLQHIYSSRQARNIPSTIVFARSLGIRRGSCELGEVPAPRWRRWGRTHCGIIPGGLLLSLLFHPII